MIEETVKRDFFKKIDALSTGERVQLKRACGQMPQDADSSTMMILYKVLPGEVKDFQCSRWLFAACVHAMWGKEDNAKRVSLTRALADYKIKSDVSESFDRKISGILDTRWEDDGFLAGKLLNLVKMMKQKGYVIDGYELLTDLISWNSDKNIIQRKWAREINNPRVETEKESEE